MGFLVVFYVNLFLSVFYVCGDNNLQIAQLFLGYNAKTNVQSGYETTETPLLAACLNGDIRMVELLIFNGADVNLSDLNGYTPLHVACEEGYTEIAQFLIEKNADPFLKDNNGKKPLNLCTNEDARAAIQECIVKKLY